MNKKELVIFRALLEEVENTLELIGGCDHEVGICACHVIDITRQAREVLKDHKLLLHNFKVGDRVKSCYFRATITEVHHYSNHVGVQWDHGTKGVIRADQLTPMTNEDQDEARR